MCGIIAVLRRPPTRSAVPADDVRRCFAVASAELAADVPTAGQLIRAAEEVERADAMLRGVPGVLALSDLTLAGEVQRDTETMEGTVARLEVSLDRGETGLDPAGLEAVNAAIIRLKDACWAVRHDRLRTAVHVRQLAGEGAGVAAVAAFTSVQVALSALDRLEVRGRDSAGLHLLVTGHDLDLDDPAVAGELDARAADPLFTSLAVRTPGGNLSFVYKAAAEIGELGDNTAALRSAITGDALLHRALASDTAEVAVLGHTRWASVGIISQANAHPLNNEEDGVDGPYVTAALNGDVDNYAELRSAEGLRIAPEFTTDAKVIPTLVSRRLADGLPMEEAFRHTVASFDGSVAVAASANDHPGQLLLALRGSGQALYVGLADDSFVVASEPYGLVEETSRYVRMDGESTGGQIVVLDRDQAGSLEGISRLRYDGAADPVGEGDVVTAEITTRDIDRAGFPHFLLKEISEAPQSFRKTLRAKIVATGNGQHAVRLADETLPPDVRRRLADGSITRTIVVGQGTAAVAGRAMATALTGAVGGSAMVVTPMLATELSGFALEDDMSDTLVVAISQSGTTTDTNRTVDLARARGAAVVAIVNRRNSDLVDKSDGVLYTSDGRDVEMAVPSTKAFYAQIAAGFLLAHAIAAETGFADAAASSEVLAALGDIPAAMEEVLAARASIAEAAVALAPSRRYWAIVGNGPNRVAAEEVRIKLSELCYKSIACDTTEDKKHIDLSAEPLILVCAAGLSGANADDVAKEVAIYRAHKAAPVVIATTGGPAYSAALHTIEVPAVHPELAFILSAMAGHLFGYEAALSIDAQARELREMRAVVEEAAIGASPQADVLAELATALEPLARRFFERLRGGAFNGNLEAATAVRLASLLRYAAGLLPLDAYELEYGRVATPGALVDDVVGALTSAIEELTRPIDAIKHQAKTVTVGISRSEDALFKVELVERLLAAGAPRDRLGYRALRTLAALDRAVVEVTGHTRYRIEGAVDEEATITVLDKGGVAEGIPSRTEEQPLLRGTKHRAAFEREVTVARGRNDGRTFILVPESKDAQVTGMTLLHVRFAEHLPPAEMREVLSGYRNRYGALVDAVTETDPVFDDERLGRLPVVDLLVDPVHVLADRWHAAG